MKLINDTQGHKIGDNALIETAEILKKTFREADLICRVGGDEFVVLITNHNNRKSLERVLARLEEKITETNSRNDRKFKIMLSIGTIITDHSEVCSINDLMSKADSLMYKDKRKKKTSGQYNNI